MKRWHQDRKYAYREWKKHHAQHVESNQRDPRRIGKSAYVIECVCDQQVGRFRKKKNGDCGNTQCYMCHGDKFPKRTLTNQEILSNIKFKEQTD